MYYIEPSRVLNDIFYRHIACICRAARSLQDAIHKADFQEAEEKEVKTTSVSWHCHATAAAAAPNHDVA